MPVCHSQQVHDHCSQHIFQFLLKKTNISTVSGDSDARFLFITCPAVENALSDGTDVAGIQRYFRARAASLG